MSQLNYWTMFGASKKAIASAILINILVISTVTLIGLSAFDESQTDNFFEGSREDQPILASQTTGEVYWVTTTQVEEDKNGDGETSYPEEVTIRHVLHHIGVEYSRHVLFELQGVRYERSAEVLGIYERELYIRFFAPDSEINVIIQIDENDVDADRWNLTGNIALVDQSGLPIVPKLYKSGRFVLPTGVYGKYRDLMTFDAEDLVSAEVSFPLDGNLMGENSNNLDEYFSIPLFTDEDMQRYEFPQFDYFTNYHLDKTNNLLLWGNSSQSFDILSTNLQIYLPDDSTTARYVSLPEESKDHNFVEWFDDGIDLYMVFSNSTTVEHGTIEWDNGSTSGEISSITQYHLLSVKDLQQYLDGTHFNIENAVSYSPIVTMNVTFHRVMITAGEFYGVLDAYYYAGQIMNGVDMIYIYGDGEYYPHPYTSILLFSSYVVDIENQSTSQQNFHLIKGSDLHTSYDSAWVDNAKLQEVSFIVDMGVSSAYQLESIVYFYKMTDKNGNVKNNLYLDSTEGRL